MAVVAVVCGLSAATLACDTVSHAPPPVIALTGIQGDGAVYEISYLVPSDGSTVAARILTCTVVPGEAGAE